MNSQGLDRLSRWKCSFVGRAVPVTVAALLTWGCSFLESDPAPSFAGLATVKITIAPEQLQVLNANRNVNARVPARVRYDYPEKGIRKSWLVEIRNQGQFSRRFFKRSYALRFPSDSLFRGKRDLNLSAQSTDDTKLRSVVGYSVVREVGFLVPELEPVALYLNEEYQGLYYLIEPIDKRFYDRRGVPIRSLFKAVLLEARWTYADGFNLRLGYEKEYPDDENFSELDRLIRAVTSATPENIEQSVAPFFDFESYLTYQACMVVIQNNDSWNNNFHLYHDERTGTLRMQPWDVDHAYDSHNPIYAPTALNDLIVANTSLRQRYLQKVLQILDGAANPSRLLPLLRSEANRLAEAYDRDPYYRAQGWTMRDRTAIMEEQIIESAQRLRTEANMLLAQ